ncbi:TonB family protein, partial [Brevundimonas sp.]|uniref:energy transducer TonB n=1 Tax=Brevundimonas sp. TaxID=1871086 RepID=UPI0025BEABF7
PEPVRTGGGGAPAAPSRVHLPPPPVRPTPPEITAPPQPAPEPPLVIGVAPDATPTPGQGLGGEGAGAGDGRGEGAGSGEGGTPPRLVRGPSMADLRREHPPAALRARRGGRGEVSCVIRADTTLEACRLVRETPPGYGFGEAALRAARYFRFQPPTRGGVPLVGERVTFGVEFGPSPGSEAR